MESQLDIFKVHIMENVPSMQIHLDKNRNHFSKQCQVVFDLLISGEVVTVKDAINKYGINSLPRRILDLKQNGVLIERLWIKESPGNVQYAIWLMTEKQIEENKKFIIK